MSIMSLQIAKVMDLEEKIDRRSQITVKGIAGTETTAGITDSCELGTK